MRKRILSVVLVLALCLAYMPGRAYAATAAEITITNVINKYQAGTSIDASLDMLTVDVDDGGISYEGWGIRIDGELVPKTSLTTETWTLGSTYELYLPILMNAGDNIDTANLVVTIAGEVFTPDAADISDSGVTIRYPITACETASFSADPTVNVGLIYNGADQELLATTPTAVGGTIEYNVNGAGWSTSLPTGKDATSYAIRYRVVGDATHLDYEAAAPVNAEILRYPNDITVTITGNTAQYTYDSEPHSVDGYTITNITPADAPFTIDDIIFTGTAFTEGTSVDAYPMGLHDTDFSYTEANFSGGVSFIVNDGRLSIAPAPAITVTAVSSNILQGTPAPDLTAPIINSEYTVSGFVGTDELDAPPHMHYEQQDGEEVPNPTDLGVYNIVIDVIDFANANNYEYVNLVGGTLRIVSEESQWDIEPTAKNNLRYNGSAQDLLNAGTAIGGTVKYATSPDGPWSTTIPTATEVNPYTVYCKIFGDNDHADSEWMDVPVELSQALEVVLAPVETTMYAGDSLPAIYTVAEGTLYGNDAELLNVTPNWETGNPEAEGVAGETYRYTLNIGSLPEKITNNYAGVIENGGIGTITVQNRPSSSGPSNNESYDFVQPEEGPGSGKIDDENWTWGERGNLPKDAATLYMVLSNNSVSEEEDNPLPYPGLGTEHFLASDDTWVLPAEDPAIEAAEVIDVRVCQDNEPIYLANGDGKVDQSTFGNSDFFTVGVGTGDTKIDYANLKTGDVVSNTSFNGVFVTKLQKSNNPTFDADLAKLKSDTIASFRAFELDHPEVFWLNGSIKLRVLTVTLGGEQTSFIFMTLVDDKGFTMRIAEYAAAGSIEAGIKQRDAAVDAIIAQIPAGVNDREKVVNLNKWFTMNNEYNRSADLSAIGYTPHRSLKSLTGNFGINGPVCDGYSRGFKTVCDRLGIPVVLETGTASIGSHSELHMWMSVKVDGTWYGMDTTWNDPIVKGKDGKVSGYENEKYLLVGNDTVVDGAKFGVSHPANKTPGGTTGVLFASLILNPNEIYGYTAIDYDDVKSTDWFFDYVQDVSARGLMNGTSPNLFSPQGTATRGQIVQILYNIAGQPEVEDVKVEGWFGVPATWAMDKGIVAGYPDGDFHGNDPVTREQLATILWAFEGAPEQSGELSFADADKVSSYAVNAMLWAKKEGLIGGKPGNLADPQGTATRAEIATIFSNYMK